MKSQLLGSVAIPAVPDLLDRGATCEFFGGTKPIRALSKARQGGGVEPLAA
jgi:hypothetical protein